MGQIEGICILIGSIVLFIAFIEWLLSGGLDSNSPFDLDEQTCEQMRASGWAEDEIEKWMNDNGGHYFEPSIENANLLKEGKS